MQGLRSGLPGSRTASRELMDVYENVSGYIEYLSGERYNHEYGNPECTVTGITCPEFMNGLRDPGGNIYISRICRAREVPIRCR